jgi:hypothetical protein
MVVFAVPELFPGDSEDNDSDLELGRALIIHELLPANFIVRPERRNDGSSTFEFIFRI